MDIDAIVRVEPKVLLEDNHLLFVAKPHSMPAQPDPSGDLSLLDWVKSYLKQRYSKPGEAFVGLVHRIDRPAGGVMVFAKTSKAAGRLHPQFRDRTLTKSYLAVVHGQTPEAGHLVDHLRKNAKQNRSYVVSPEAKGAKRAELRFSLLESARELSLLEVELMTGRHHQIRAQLAAHGYPLVGDVKYGAKRPLRGGKIALWSGRLGLLHPISKKPVEVECPPPDHPPWSYFLALGRE